MGADYPAQYDGAAEGSTLSAAPIFPNGLPHSCCARLFLGHVMANRTPDRGPSNSMVMGEVTTDTANRCALETPCRLRP